MWQERGYNGDSLWIWGIAAPYGDSTDIEEFIDSTGVTFPLMETTSGDSIVSLYEVTYTPRYFAICPDHSMKGFNYGAEENVFIFIDNCEDDTTTNINNKNIIPVTFYANNLYIISDKENEVRIVVSNVLGQQIIIESHKLIKGNNSVNMNLEKGFYIINIYSIRDNISNTLKVIVQ